MGMYGGVDEAGVRPSGKEKPASGIGAGIAGLKGIIIVPESATPESVFRSCPDECVAAKDGFGAKGNV